MLSFLYFTTYCQMTGQALYLYDNSYMTKLMIRDLYYWWTYGQSNPKCMLPIT